MKNFTGNKSLVIYDSFGRPVKEYDLINPDEVIEDVSNYAKGVYLVKVCGNNRMLTSKFVVN